MVGSEVGFPSRGTTTGLYRIRPPTSIVFPRLEVHLYGARVDPLPMSRHVAGSVERLWRGLADEVIGSVDIRLDGTPVARPEQAALDTFASVLVMMLDWFAVEERAFTGVAFLGKQHLDASPFSLVGQHGDEACVRDAHEVLVVDLAERNTLLPAVVFTNNQVADVVMRECLDDESTCQVQQAVDTPVASKGQCFQPP